MIIVKRYIGETTLNGLETLMDKYDSPMHFINKESAIDFLKNNGCDDISDEEIEDHFIFEEL